AMSSASQTGTPQRLRLGVVRPSGERRHCLTIIERDSDAEGGGRILGLVQDLTELQRSEEERRKLAVQVILSQKLESLGVLAGGIAHDFNNLLTSILGNAELALCELPVGHPACSYLDDVEIVGRRAADLCRQMLAYSGKGRFVVQSVAINDLVREMDHLLSVSVGKKTSLTYQLARDLPCVMADVTQVRQIVMNLVTNASEAIAHEGGAIVVSTGVIDCDEGCFKDVVRDNTTHAPGRYVYLEVRDDGCGMDRETVEKIFDPFFSTKFTGRGLGLPAVLGIVRGHQGALRVRSTVGHGTTIQILLPAFDAIDATLESGRS
ncbi:MAG TPA: ATP-binding protein, partial [Polyangiaceae bacterium]|nr:ATP-binding protein [Polyangiaceae bacterium]